MWFVRVESTHFFEDFQEADEAISINCCGEQRDEPFLIGDTPGGSHSAAPVKEVVRLAVPSSRAFPPKARTNFGKLSR